MAIRVKIITNSSICIITPESHPIIYGVVKDIGLIVHGWRNITANPHSCHGNSELTRIETIDTRGVCIQIGKEEILVE